MADDTTPRQASGPNGERRGEAHQPTGGSPDQADDLARVDDWAGQLRSDAAAQLRRREHWLRRQAAEDATVAGVLVDHAEQDSTLAITTRSGNRHVGRLRGAGAALVIIEVVGARVAIELEDIDTFQALPNSKRRTLDPMGHRSRAEATTMTEVLSQVVDDRPEVTLVTRSGEHVAGELVAVGRDVLMVRPPDRGALIYLPVASVSEALLPASTGSG